MSRLIPRNIDSGSYPDWVEFTPVAEDQTDVAPKNGFVLQLPVLGLYPWRLVPGATMLLVEYWNGAAWIEKGRFTA